MTSVDNQHASEPVKRRKVFYVGGFDPRGIKYYRSLYRKESAKQAKILDCQLTVGKLEQTANGGQWQVTYKKNDHSSATDTSYEYLSYDDLIQQYFEPLTPTFFVRGLRFFFRYLFNPSVAKQYYSAAKGTFVTGTYPVVVFALILLSALTLPAASGYFITTVTSSLLAGLIAAAATLWAVTWLVKRYQKHLSTAVWLLNDFCYIDRVVKNQYHDLDKRLDAFAGRISDYITRSQGDKKRAQDDEILLVFYSFGTLMLPLLIDKLQAVIADNPHQHIAVMSIGQTLSMIPCWPNTQHYRDKLAAISGLPLHWHDFTSAVDGPCFPLVDIYGRANVPHAPNAKGLPKILSARFHTMFTPETYRTLKKDRFRVHFQYLMATEKPSEYDYFLITAGDRTLTARYQDKPSLH